MQNGILLGSGISIAYFILSLISLLLLFGVYETVFYGIKSVLYWTKIACLIYGFAIAILGILIFVIGAADISQEVPVSWSAMS